MILLILHFFNFQEETVLADFSSIITLMLIIEEILYLLLETTLIHLLKMRTLKTYKHNKKL